MTFRIGAVLALGIATFLLSPAPARAQAKPLFASDTPIQLSIQGPLQTLMHNRNSAPIPGTISLGGETLPVSLAVRGITRRTSEICDFPPIRVDFTRPPPAASLFAGQHRLKLVTHCRNSASFQQYVLLEYAAYRMYNLLTPLSLRARLATIDYLGADGRPITQRVGFFLEDVSDAARRNGLRAVHAPELIPVNVLSPRDSARYVLFQHMIANHDWSMRAGPAGEDCCHNAKLIGNGSLSPGAVIPLPYDFDFSGFVSAPYATPPGEIEISSVKQRYYRGYCIHNAEVLAVAGQMRSAHGAIVGVLSQVPGLDDKTRSRAAAFIEPFFGDIATDASVQSRILSHCLKAS